jgi:hypothetical protein
MGTRATDDLHESLHYELGAIIGATAGQKNG